MLKEFFKLIALLIIVPMLVSGCAKRSLVIRVPAGSGSEWGEVAETVNQSVSILRQLEDEPDSISIVTDRPDGNSTNKGTIQGAF